MTALFAGFLPALQASRAADTGAEALRASRGNSSSRSTLRGVLMVGQITLSVVLLIGAGLFVRSLWSATRTDVGFDHERTLTVFIERDADVGSAVARRGVSGRPRCIARRCGASRRCRACVRRRFPRARCRSS